MKTVYKTKRVAVDSGIILICDKDFYKKYGKIYLPELLPLGEMLEVPKGKYNLSYEVEATWNGHIYGDGRLYVTSGIVIVSDPCYFIKDSKWQKFLDDYEFTLPAMPSPEGCVLIDSMGGDGNYPVKFKLAPIEGRPDANSSKGKTTSKVVKGKSNNRLQNL